MVARPLSAAGRVSEDSRNSRSGRRSLLDLRIQSRARTPPIMPAPRTQSSEKIVIVSGALANKPHNGGEAWVRMSWATGLRQLGCHVYFIEQIRTEGAT